MDVRGVNLSEGRVNSLRGAGGGCVTRPARRALWVPHRLPEGPAVGPRLCLSEAVLFQSADLPPEEESESSSVDFGSSERLGSWREDEARSGAGVHRVRVEHGGHLYWGVRTRLGPAEPPRRHRLTRFAFPAAAAHAPSPGGQESDLSKVRQKLRKFLLRRPTLQTLREKGYIKGTGGTWRARRRCIRGRRR